MTLLQRIDCRDISPDEERPDTSRVLDGDPVHTTWNVEQRDGLYCGVWQSTPGKWKVSYDEWEYIYIHHGISILTDASGTETTLRAGDRYVIRPGFEGTWEVVETTLKDYVILQQTAGLLVSG